MGGCMAPAAFDTIRRHLLDFDRKPSAYDAIVTGDLGVVGQKILIQLLREKNMDIASRHQDCGLILFDQQCQDVHAGGSGCGCSASVLCCHILPEMLAGRYKDVILAATGALLSPTMVQQGDTIPGISHLVHLHFAEKEGD